MMLFGEVVVKLDDAVITVAGGRDRTKEVVKFWVKTCYRTGSGRWPEARRGRRGACRERV